MVLTLCERDLNLMLFSDLKIVRRLSKFKKVSKGIHRVKVKVIHRAFCTQNLVAFHKFNAEIFSIPRKLYSCGSLFGTLGRCKSSFFGRETT